MNARRSNQHKYSEAGEQAGRVISEFFSLAEDFSKRFEKECSAKGRASRYSPDGKTDSDCYSTSGKGHPNRAYDNRAYDSDHEARGQRREEWQQAGEYLRELREAAGYTLDGFAKAMNRRGAAHKVESVEQGRDIFPEEWLDQISALLKQNDPIEFFEKLRGMYGVDTTDNNRPEVATETISNGPSSNHADTPIVTDISANDLANQRKQKLANIFSDDQLERLTDTQFDQLLGFVEANCQSALKLVSKE